MKIILHYVLTLLSLVSEFAATSTEHSVASRGIRGERRLDCDGDQVLKSATVVTRSDVEFLAGDALQGRQDDTPGGIMAIDYIVDELMKMGALSLNEAGLIDVGDDTGRETYVRPFSFSCVNGGVSTSCKSSNVLAYIPGSQEEVSNEYIILGAHYDHLSVCRSVPNSDSKICNGATDNAASVAILLGVGRALAALEIKPRRSIILAFWGAEEDGTLGSDAFLTSHSLRLTDEFVAYINFDIQGANLSPSLRGVTFAVGSETGGSALQSALINAVTNNVGLQVFPFSAILGQDRSDHKNFLKAKIPSIFFTDSNNGCYHTTGDETKRVDFVKLEKQGKIALRVAYQLAIQTSKPTFTTSTNPIVYSDAKGLDDIMNRLGPADMVIFSENDQKVVQSIKATTNKIVAAGPASFQQFLGDFQKAAADFVAVFARSECV